MDFIISSIGKFHSFSVAKELNRQRKLRLFITAHPRWKIDRYLIGKNNSVFIDFIQTFNLISKKYTSLHNLNKELNWFSHHNFDLKSKIYLEKLFKNYNFKGDKKIVFLSLSGSGLYSGRFMRKLGILHLCDVGSTHIKNQNIVLRNEFKKLKIKYHETDNRLIEKECLEFEEADKIIVPSNFVKKTFLKMNIPEKKLIKIPYGSDNFYFTYRNKRNYDGENLIISFAGEFSIRKGLHYLLDYFGRLPKNIKKRLQLRLFGSFRSETKTLLSRYDNDNIFIKSSISQKSLSEQLNISDIYAILSIEEGLSLTIPQAMSVGCIVIATPNTGAEEIIDNGVNGFIINHNFNEFLAVILLLIENKDLRKKISNNAINSMNNNYGFKNYTDRLIKCVE